MYIPASVLIVLVIIYLYYQDTLRDEISSLRGEIRNSHSNDNLERYDYYESTPKVLKKKEEYTFQESQDRGLLGVKYDASEKDIHDAYSELRKKYNPHESPDSRIRFSEVQLAYKRLIKIKS